MSCPSVILGRAWLGGFAEHQQCGVDDAEHVGDGVSGCEVVVIDPGQLGVGGHVGDEDAIGLSCLRAKLA